MFDLSDAERNFLQEAKRNANYRIRSLESQIDRLEHDLAVLKARYREARRIECDTTNMMNRVEKFDRERITFKW